MKRLVKLTGEVVAAGTLVAALAVAAAGVAGAVPDVKGDTYGDAASDIADAGGTPVVASRVGNQLAEEDCIVTNVWEASFVRDTGDEFEPDDGEVLVALNCNGSHATATGAGASALSPEGRQAKAAEAAEAEAPE